MSIEQSQSRIDVLKGEAMVVLRSTFMRKVQIEDEKESNEIQLHFHRGLVEGLELAKRAMDEIQKSEELEMKIEALKARNFQASNNHEDRTGAEAVIERERVDA